MLGKTIRMQTLVRWLLMAMAQLAERLCGQKEESDLTVLLVQIACRHRRYRSTKAESRLGDRPGPLEPALVAAVNWYRENGFPSHRSSFGRF